MVSRDTPRTQSEATINIQYVDVFLGPRGVQYNRWMDASIWDLGLHLPCWEYETPPFGFVGLLPWRGVWRSQVSWAAGRVGVKDP